MQKSEVESGHFMAIETPELLAAALLAFAEKIYKLYSWRGVWSNNVRKASPMLVFRDREGRL